MDEAPPSVRGGVNFRLFFSGGFVIAGATIWNGSECVLGVEAFFDAAAFPREKLPRLAAQVEPEISATITPNMRPLVESEKTLFTKLAIYTGSSLRPS